MIDQDTFTYLYKHYFTEISFFLAKKGALQHELEDVVQMVFTQLWRTRALYKAECSLKNWLYLIARTEYLQHVRKKNSLKRRHEQAPTESALLSTKEPSALSVLCSQESLKTITRRLEDEIHVELKRKTQGETLKEIADKRGVSVQCVKGRIWRSRRDLKKEIEV